MNSNSTATAERPAKPRDRYWRSLSELHESKEFNQFLHREFPVAASEYPEGVSRRRWLQLMAASMSVAGAVGCRYPTETIAPFVLRPEGRVPGETYSRSTSVELAGRVYNLLVTNVDGRPIKIEGNAKHPGGGTTDAYAQASILGLYDPDRARGDDGVVLKRAASRVEVADWSDAITFATGMVKVAAADGGKSFALLMSPTQSPSLVRMVKALRERLPEMMLCRFDGVHGDAMRQATKMALGTAAKPLLDLDKASVVLSVQSDFLGSDAGAGRNARTFAAMRDPDKEMSRLYVVEGAYSNTGATADTRMAMRPSQMTAFLAEVERRIDGLIAGGDSVAPPDDEIPFDDPSLDPQSRVERLLSVACKELKEAGEAGVVLVGESLGAEAIAAGIRINSKLGSLGKVQRFMPLVDDGLGGTISLADLEKAINGNKVESLVVLGDNPGFAAPGDVKLLAAISRVEKSIYLGEYDDETSAKCQWSLPMSHPLESWGDCIGDDGVYGVGQPQILPLLGGRSAVELLAVMLEADEIQGRDIVRRTADAVAGESLSEREWRRLLHEGFVEAIAVKPVDAKYQGPAGPVTEAKLALTNDIDQDDLDVLFLPADGVYDGRFANNGWLQEMPQSLTKITWGNAAVLSPRTAKALKVTDGSMVALRRGDVTLELPVYEMPGVAPGVVAVSIGYGRTRAGMVGGMVEEDVPVVGTDVSPIRTSDSLLWAGKIEGRPRYVEYTWACTQDHWAIDDLGRRETERRSFQLIREGTTALLDKNEHFASDKGPHVPHVGKAGSVWDEPIDRIKKENPALPQWGMSVDLNKCFGCNACVIACQSENNVPIVGKEQVTNGREMHWLRIDRYFQGDEESASVVSQPLACQHCETAPCEQVCPVAATVHTDEGLNAMAYNRCIGTRYCANNCPYKVRRFNYFNYNVDVGVGYGIDAYPSNIEKANRKLQQLVLNPDVTVRGRGVMEKCTYCVQRIEQGKIEARKDGGRPVRDGEIKTACQMACPSGAIEFGNVQDENAVVTKKHNDRRAYGMLSQLNVKPRTVYLAKIKNTHPRLMTSIQLADLQNYGTPKHHGEGHGHDDDHGHDDHHAHDHDHPHE
jgi:MoCo/4Fe-4S cofactor protein with predicted Tat translocation signal